MSNLGEAIFTKDKPLSVSVISLVLPAPDISHSAGGRVNSPICIYTILFSCQWTGISLKGETDKMRRLALAIALACVLSGVARAGEIHSTGVVAPPPPPSTVNGGRGDPYHRCDRLRNQSTVLTIILTIISIVR